jgi:quercetin dioxygenase-like cupin family protein
MVHRYKKFEKSDYVLVAALNLLVAAAEAWPCRFALSAGCRRVKYSHICFGADRRRGVIPTRCGNNPRREPSVKSKFATVVGSGLLGLSILSIPAAQSAEDGAAGRKPVMINRLYTGPDGETHVEEIEAKFTSLGEVATYKLLANAGAELRRAPPGRVLDWHTAPRRQYVITLSGHAELEVAGGKRILIGPGSIDLVEDVTGKGHITRTVGNEERVTIQIPLADR